MVAFPTEEYSTSNGAIDSIPNVEVKTVMIGEQVQRIECRRIRINNQPVWFYEEHGEQIILEELPDGNFKPDYNVMEI